MTNSPLAGDDAAQNGRGPVSRRALVAGLAGALGRQDRRHAARRDCGGSIEVRLPGPATRHKQRVT